MSGKDLSESWDDKLKKAEEHLRESFWGDFLVGGLIVSGVFIIIESLGFPQFINSRIGISLLLLAPLSIVIRLIYFRIKYRKIKNMIKNAEKDISNKKYKEALELLNDLLRNERNLKNNIIWNNKGIVLYYLERYEESLECFNYALEINPFYMNAIFGKSITLTKIKRYENSIENSNKLLALDDNFKKAWNNKGYALNALGRYDEALKCLDKALKLDNGLKEAWVNKGNALSGLGRYDEASKCYDSVLALDPNYKKAWINKGNALSDLGQKNEALNLYDKALERYDEASKCYDSVLALDPNYKNAWYNYACVESLRNNLKESIDRLRTAINLDENFREIARKDSDFNNIRESEEFNELVGD